MSEVLFGPLGLSDTPTLSLRPAIGDGTTTEYLLNSQVLDSEGDYQDYASNIGFWWVTRDNNIATHPNQVYLYGENIRSETYSQPEPADSTGDGTTCVNHISVEAPNDDCVIAEAQLNPDDNRMEQVQYSSGYLYSSLNTSLNFGDEDTVTPDQPDIWDGAAWFLVNTKNANVTRQGYVGEEGTNLLYPSMVKSKSGTYFMDFSTTSPDLDTGNPSTGYTLSKNLGNSWTPITTTAVGSGPHVSFSDNLPEDRGPRPRWGDYSAMAFDPTNGTVWMADEYVPPADEGGSDLVDNWGTFVWGLSG